MEKYTDFKTKQDILLRKTVLLIPQPIFINDFEKQAKMYKDILKKYNNSDYMIYIKPHPRDTLNYKKYFTESTVLEKYFPLEVLNLNQKFHFDIAITVFSTSIDVLEFVDQKIVLGMDFLDSYR
jgi:hypothetical protein